MGQALHFSGVDDDERGVEEIVAGLAEAVDDELGPPADFGVVAGRQFVELVERARRAGEERLHRGFAGGVVFVAEFGDLPLEPGGVFGARDVIAEKGPEPIGVGRDTAVGQHAEVVFGVGILLRVEQRGRREGQHE